jgi:tetratricopeptide (TPR) repeat protein
VTGRTESRPGRSVAAALLTLVALVAVVYGSSVSYEFVFDDGLLVTENPVASWSLDRTPDLFASAANGVTYRPVRMLSYMVDHAIAGGHEAWVFHLSNLLWHLAAVLTVFGLARALLGGLIGPWLAAAVFAVHPLGSEAVVYVAGRRDLLLGLFSTASLWCLWRLLEARSAKARLGPALAALLLAMLALGSKEIAVVLPVLAVLLALLHWRQHPQASSTVSTAQWLGMVAGGAFIIGAVGWLYEPEIRRGVSSLMADQGLAPQPALSFLVLAHYLVKMLWPQTLQADYRPHAFSLPEAAMDGPSLLAAVFLAAWVGLGLWLLWRGRVAGVGLLWALVALLPVGQLLPYGELIAEHNSYLPLAGFSLAIGDGIGSLASRRYQWAWGLAVLLVAVLSARSLARVPVWANDVTLWQATLEVAPRAARSRHNLAVAQAQRGQLLEARASFLAALELVPGDPDVLLGLGSMEERLGDHIAAEEIAHQVMAVRPDLEAMTLLGWTQLGQGKLDQARESFALVLQVAPDAIEGRRGMELVKLRSARRRPRSPQK